MPTLRYPNAMPAERQEKRDWVDWHRAYEDPGSRLSRRLPVVQDLLREAIERIDGHIRLISMCAGEGRDVIGVLADHARRNDVTARLVELDTRIAEVARASAREHGLDQVDVVVADAALTDSYAGAVPANIILACGIFGNITEENIRRTVEFLPSLCAPGATVIWTRGQRRYGKIARTICGWFVDAGFNELAFVEPPDETFRVGAHRLIADPRPFESGVRMFEFFR
jgi:hypothetical protein